MEKYPLISVTWIDPYSHDEWIEIEQIKPKVAVMNSVGYQLERTKDYLVLALNLDTQEPKASCVMVIPSECIKKTKRVK